MMSDSAELISIGELATVTSVPASTIRYYEKRGLIAPKLRTSGRRQYGPEQSSESKSYDYVPTPGLASTGASFCWPTAAPTGKKAGGSAC